MIVLVKDIKCKEFKYHVILIKIILYCYTTLEEIKRIREKGLRVKNDIITLQCN